MSPVRVVLGMIRFSPRYFVLCVSFAIFVFFVVPIPLGLATRAFFDALAVEPAGLNAWSAIALLVSAQLAEATSNVLFRSPWSGLQQESHVLLRRNLIAGILRGYGRHGLRVSSSETISRFRDDP